MRKLWKALVGILAAVAMLFTGGLMATSASADDAATGMYPITVPSGDDHTYAVYQIFVGDIHNGKLSNIKWGQNGTNPNGTSTPGTAVDQAVLDKLSNLTGTDAHKLETIKKYAVLTVPFGTVSKDKPLSVPGGYYLIKDNDSISGDDSYSLYVMRVVGPAEVIRKAEVPTSFKKVLDTNDSTGNPADAWQDSADYDIDDSVPFRLTATLPENFADYQTYALTFHDKQDAGLTFDPNSVVVKLNGNQDIPAKIGNHVNFTVLTNVDHGTEKEPPVDTFDVVFNNIKDLKVGSESFPRPLTVQKGDKLTVEYKSTLNENAKIGAAGNANLMHITFSNDPNGSDAIGATPDDKVTVFTYQVTINKVDDKNQALAGAAFKLEKKYKALPKGEQIGDTWRKEGDGDAAAYWKTIKNYTTDGNPTSFDFKGLDDGDYLLAETVTPEGYNSIEPIKFTITAEHEVESDDPQLLRFVITGGFEITQTSKELSIGIASFDVVNKPGSELPETGGMGTTVLYAAGAVIVVAAALGLAVVLRKRQNAR